MEWIYEVNNITTVGEENPSFVTSLSRPPEKEKDRWSQIPKTYRFPTFGEEISSLEACEWTQRCSKEFL